MRNIACFALSGSHSTPGLLEAQFHAFLATFAATIKFLAAFNFFMSHVSSDTKSCFHFGEISPLRRTFNPARRKKAARMSQRPEGGRRPMPVAFFTCVWKTEVKTFISSIAAESAAPNSINKVRPLENNSAGNKSKEKNNNNA